MNFNDEIILIEELGEEETIDIEVSGNHLFFANNILTHNSALEAEEIHQGHIQGGISKVNTVDNLIPIIQTDQMRAAGEYVLSFAKTRNSDGVGKSIVLGWDPLTLIVSSLEAKQSNLKLTKKTDMLTEKIFDTTPKNGNSLLNLTRK